MVRSRIWAWGPILAGSALSGFVGCAGPGRRVTPPMQPVAARSATTPGAVPGGVPATPGPFAEPGGGIGRFFPGLYRGLDHEPIKTSRYGDPYVARLNKRHEAEPTSTAVNGFPERAAIGVGVPQAEPPQTLAAALSVQVHPDSGPPPEVEPRPAQVAARSRRERPRPQPVVPAPEDDEPEPAEIRPARGGGWSRPADPAVREASTEAPPPPPLTSLRPAAAPRVARRTPKLPSPSLPSTAPAAPSADPETRLAKAESPSPAPQDVPDARAEGAEPPPIVDAPPLTHAEAPEPPTDPAPVEPRKVASVEMPPPGAVVTCPQAGPEKRAAVTEPPTEDPLALVDDLPEVTDAARPAEAVGPEKIADSANSDAPSEAPKPAESATPATPIETEPSNEPEKPADIEAPPESPPSIARAPQPTSPSNAEAAASTEPARPETPPAPKADPDAPPTTEPAPTRTVPDLPADESPVIVDEPMPEPAKANAPPAAGASSARRRPLGTRADEAVLAGRPRMTTPRADAPLADMPPVQFPSTYYRGGRAGAAPDGELQRAAHEAAPEPKAERRSIRQRLRKLFGRED